MVEMREAVERQLEEAREEVARVKKATKDEMLQFKDACDARLRRVAGVAAACRPETPPPQADARSFHPHPGPCREFAGAMRKQLKEKEHSMRQVETMHTAVRNAYEERIAELEGRVRDLKAALRRAEERRALDMEVRWEGE